ncbi:MAG: hypothetical protein GY920_09835 [Aliivibrio sp.]|nr:hypothetical protein [Aliivibrio sp.]MCP4323424.1 hypothetical protein [Alteromonadales bacterium]
MAIQFVNNVDFNANQAQSIRIENLATDPSTELVIGRIIFNTSADTLKQYVADAGSGSPGWVEVGSSSGVETLTAAQGTFISFTAATSAIGDVDLGTFDLSAAGTPDATKYLRGDNSWEPITGIYAWDIAGDTGSETIVNGDTVTFAGDTNITTAYDANNNTLSIDLDDSVTLAGELTVNGTGQSSFAGQVTIPTTPVAGTDAASKAYVDGLVAGGLTFRGTFNAATGEILSGVNSGSYIYQLTGTPPAPFDPSANRVEVKVGDYYIVATAGQFYGNGGTGGGGQQLDVGDSVIGFQAASANNSDKDDWSIVQSDEGVTDVQEATAAGLLGASVTSTGAGGTGSVTVGLDVNGLTEDTSPATDDTIVIYDTSASTNKKATLANIAAAIDISKGVRISLDNSTSGVTRTEAGGLTTFAIDVSSSSVLSASDALDVKIEIVTKTATPTGTAGQTAFADITRSGATLNVIFTGSVANGDFWALLVDIG